jgi:hypothetical protein
MADDIQIIPNQPAADDLTSLSDERLLDQARAAGVDATMLLQTLHQPTRLRPVTPDQYTIDRRNTKGTPEWLEKNGPLSGKSEGYRVAAGAGQGVVDVGRHLGNLVGLIPDEDIERYKQLDAPLKADPNGRVGGVLGAAAPLAIPGMGIEALTARYAPMLAASRVASGALQGAGQGYIMGDPGNRGASTVAGLIGGGVIPAAGSAVNVIRRGVNPTPAARQLLDAGVDLTPGQMNPAGTLNKLEESARTLPIVGPAIEKARGDAQAQFQKAVMQDAAAPGSKLQTPPGDINKLFDEAYRTYEPLYDQAKGFPIYPKIVNQNGVDIPLPNALRYATQDRSVQIGNKERKQVADWLDNQLTQLSHAHPGKLLDSEDLLTLRSTIRTQGRQYNNGSSVAERATGQLYNNAEDAITKTLESQLPADAMNALNAADTGYAKLKVVEDAVARAKDRPGGFTGNQLSEAVKGSTTKQRYARGQGNLRDWSSAGQEIFSTRTPMTGATLAPVLGTAAVGYAHPAVAAPLVGGLAGLTLTQLGRKMAAGNTAPQRALNTVAQRISDAAQRAGNAAGLSPMQQAAVGAAGNDVLRGALVDRQLQSNEPVPSPLKNANWWGNFNAQLPQDRNQ